VYFAVNCDLEQYVTLERDASISTVAATWNDGSIGLVGVSNIQTIRDGIKDLVDTFVNDYLSVNPQK